MMMQRSPIKENENKLTVLPDVEAEPTDSAVAGRFSSINLFASSVVLNFLKIAPVNPLTCASHSGLTEEEIQIKIF